MSTSVGITLVSVNATTGNATFTLNGMPSISTGATSPYNIKYYVADGANTYSGNSRGTFSGSGATTTFTPSSGYEITLSGVTAANAVGVLKYTGNSNILMFILIAVILYYLLAKKRR
jgi:hypothetical protein